MKQFLRVGWQRVSSFLPIFLLKKLSGSCLFPYYHMVSDETPSYFDGSYPLVSSRKFEQHLDYILKHWKPLSLSELIRSVDAVGSPPANSFHLTFDDGFSQIFDIVFPILKRKGIPATTFLCSDSMDNKHWLWEHSRALVLNEVSNLTPIAFKELMHSVGISVQNQADFGLSLTYFTKEKIIRIGEVLGLNWQELLQKNRPYLSGNEIRTMISHGFTFGAHSLDHPVFQDIGAAEQIKQAVESVNYVQQMFQLDYRVFAFPYSEAGLAPSLLKELFDKHRIDLCFGTRGLIPDEYSRLVQRLWMESDDLDVKKIISVELSRKTMRRWVHNDRVTRK